MRLIAMTGLAALVYLVLPLPGARSDDAAEKLLLATCKLANDASTGTSTVVLLTQSDGTSRRFAITANHVLEQMAGDTCVLVSRAPLEGGAFQRLEVRVAIRANGQRTWLKHPGHDLAALPLPDSPNIEALPFDCLPTPEQLADFHAGDAVGLAVFPERAEANSIGFAMLRGGSIASYPLVPATAHPMFLVDTVSWPGDSGGPVMHDSLRAPNGGPLLIGVVRGMRNVTDTVKESRFVERRTHYPLGIAEVLHAALVREMIPDTAAAQPAPDQQAK